MVRRGRPLALATWGGTVVALGLGAFLMAPLVVVVASAFAPSPSLSISSEQWAAGAGAGRGFAYVLAVYGGHLRHSLGLAVAAGAIALGLGLPAGAALGLAPPTRSARALEVLLTLPLAVPGLAAALALLTAFGDRAGQWQLLLLGHVLYTLPYAVRTVAAAVRVAALERALAAARTLGAGTWLRLRLVVWPALRRAAATSLLMALAVSFGEFNVTFLLATPSWGTFPTALYLTYTTNSFPVAAAATTLLLLGLMPLLAAALILGGEPEQGA
jgi:putative spermidine/putrescine transport system permease protein